VAGARYDNTFSGSTWSGWNAVPSGGQTLDSPDATAFNGALYAFVQGTDSGIYLNRLG
jgi:hypothetical protein